MGSNPTEFTKVCFHELIASSIGTGKRHCLSSPSCGEYVGWNPTGSSDKEETWVQAPSVARMRHGSSVGQNVSDLYGPLAQLVRASDS